MLINIVLLAALCAPLVMTYLLVIGKITLIPGLIASVLIAPLHNVSAKNCLIIWKTFAWTSKEGSSNIYVLWGISTDILFLFAYNPTYN